jgi:hypothetical protein
MSQYTSFVAVEQKVVNIGGKQRTVDVPVEMPDGVSYEGILGDAGGRSEAKTRAISLGRRGMQRQSNLYSFGANGGAAGALGYNAPAPATVTGKPAQTLALPAVKLQVNKLSESLSSVDGRFKDDNGVMDSETVALLRADPEKAEKKIALRKPEEQKQIRAQWKEMLRAGKLHQKLRELLKKPGAQAIDVQVWVDSIPADGLKKLKALGFEFGATLAPGKLLLGKMRLDKIDALLALPWVAYVEPPKFK